MEMLDDKRGLVKILNYFMMRFQSAVDKYLDQISPAKKIRGKNKKKRKNYLVINVENSFTNVASHKKKDVARKRKRNVTYAMNHSLGRRNLIIHKKLITKLKILILVLFVKGIFRQSGTEEPWESIQIKSSMFAENVGNSFNTNQIWIDIFWFIRRKSLFLNVEGVFMHLAKFIFIINKPMIYQESLLCAIYVAKDFFSEKFFC